MRVELCAWRDAIQLLEQHPRLSVLGLARAIQITETTSKSFIFLYRKYVSK